MKRILLTVPVLVILLSLTGCPGNFDSRPPAAGEVGDGETGLVSLRFVSPLSRTQLPTTPVFAAYEIIFTPYGGAGAALPLIYGGGTLGEYDLPVGYWNLAITLFADAERTVQRASGSTVKSFEVIHGETVDVEVLLTFYTDSMTGYGIFAWDIIQNIVDYLDLPAQVEITLEPLGVGVSRTFNGLTGVAENVAVGFYLLTVRLGIDRIDSNAWLRTAVFSDILHIYPGQTTNLRHTFAADSYFHTLPAAWLVGYMTGGFDLASPPPAGRVMTRQDDGTFVWRGHLLRATYHFRFSLTDTTGWDDTWNGSWFVPQPDNYLVNPGRIPDATVSNLVFVRYHHGASANQNASWRLEPIPGYHEIILDPVERQVRVRRIGPPANIWLTGFGNWAFPGTPMIRQDDGTFTLEVEVGTSRSFRFNLQNTTTSWSNGIWLAPSADGDTAYLSVGGARIPNPMTHFALPSGDGRAWNLRELDSAAGIHVLTVDTANMRLYVERPVIVTAVTVGTDATSVPPGGSAVFTATVTGTNVAGRVVEWSVERVGGGTDATTTAVLTDGQPRGTVGANGIVTGTLSVSADEDAGYLIVRAAVVDYYPVRSDTASIPVVDLPALPDATGLVLGADGVARWGWVPALTGQTEAAAGYDLRLYRDVTPRVYVASTTVLSGNEREHDFAAAMIADAMRDGAVRGSSGVVDEYVFTVTVMSGNIDVFVHSAVATSGPRAVTQRVNVGNAWWFGSGVARWVNPDDSGGYRIRLYRDEVYIADERPWPRSTTVNPDNSAETVTTIDFAWQGVSANSAAMYTFTVTALGRSTLELDSAPSADAGLTPRHFSVMGYTGIYATGDAARVWAVTEGRRNGNVRYVAGGENGRIAWSEDGITWTLASQGANPTAIFGSNDVRAFAHSPILGGDFGRFVAVGHGGVAARSDDGGATWITMTTGFTYNMLSVAYDNRVFLAGASFGRIRRSTDGISFGTAGLGFWQGSAADPAILNWGHVEAMVFDAAGSRFVAFAGNNASNANYHGQHAWTRNGVDLVVGNDVWGHVANGFAHPGGVMRNVMNVAVSDNGIFVATFPNNPNLLRSNGLAGSPPWAWHNHQVGDGILAVNFSNGSFISVGSGGNAGISTDGTDWLPLSNSFTGNISAAHRMENGNVILAGPGRFEVVTP